MKINVYNNTTDIYNITTELLQLYYRSADYRSLLVTTLTTVTTGHYRFRGKAPMFADAGEFVMVHLLQLMLAGECKANCIKPAETQMSGIRLLWLV